MEEFEHTDVISQQEIALLEDMFYGVRAERNSQIEDWRKAAFAGWQRELILRNQIIDAQKRANTNLCAFAIMLVALAAIYAGGALAR